MRYIYTIVLIICLHVSCSDVDDNSYEKISESYYGIELNVNVKVEHYEVDIPFSNEYLALVNNDTLFVLDHRSSILYAIDSEGNVLTKLLGFGQGPRELPIKGAMFFIKNDDEYLIMGPGSDLYHFDLGFNRKRTSIYSLNSSYSEAFIRSNALPNEPRSYEVSYASRVIIPHNGKLYIPLSSEYPFSVYNQFEDLYIKEGRVFGILDIESAEIKELFGRISPHYYDVNLPRFLLHPLVGKLNEDMILISSFGDSLMHIFDFDGKHVKSFGVNGYGLKNDYPIYRKTKNESIFKEYAENLVFNYGYYLNLKTFGDLNKTIFRTFVQHGRGSKTAFLQIFQNYNLIGTLPLETDFFSMAGNIGDYFISVPYYDDNDGIVKIKRLKIEL